MELNLRIVALCPKCGLPGRKIWESEDKRTIAIRCSFYHRHLTAKKQSEHDEKTSKNIVFLVAN